MKTRNIFLCFNYIEPKLPLAPQNIVFLLKNKVCERCFSFADRGCTNGLEKYLKIKLTFNIMSVYHPTHSMFLSRFWTNWSRFYKINLKRPSCIFFQWSLFLMYGMFTFTAFWSMMCSVGVGGFIYHEAMSHCTNLC